MVTQFGRREYRQRRQNFNSGLAARAVVKQPQPANPRSALSQPGCLTQVGLSPPVEVDCTIESSIAIANPTCGQPPHFDKKRKATSN